MDFMRDYLRLIDTNTAGPRYKDLITRKSNLPGPWFPLSEEPIYFTAEQALEYGFIDEILDAGAERESRPADANEG